MDATGAGQQPRVNSRPPGWRACRPHRRTEVCGRLADDAPRRARRQRHGPVSFVTAA
jgi:hypothetical protein